MSGQLSRSAPTRVTCRAVGSRTAFLLPTGKLADGVVARGGSSSRSGCFWARGSSAGRLLSRTSALSTRVSVAGSSRHSYALTAADSPVRRCVLDRRRFASGAATLEEPLQQQPQSPGLGALLAADGARRFLFVGGKGGVGKTTTAAALAVRQAALGRKTLVVSTDPAHSLGDALGVELSGEPRQISLDGLECAGGSLYAMEINPQEVVDNFRRAMRLDKLRAMLEEKRGGLGAGLLHALASTGIDLQAVAELLQVTPPGVDEAVALGHLMQLLGDSNAGGDFERVVIDTAPTGHTLRLLAFPRFLHGLIGTILAINEKFTFSPASRLFGSIVGGGEEVQQQLQVSKAFLERSMNSMSAVCDVFKDADMTNFVVVAIPTHLAVAESKRLLAALEEDDMPVRHIVMNQCPFVFEDEDSDTFAEVDIEELLASTSVAASSADEVKGITAQQAASLRRILTRVAKQRQDALQRVEAFEREVGENVHVVRSPVFSEELTGPLRLDKYARMVCQ